jgi:hypothetical protein
VLCATLCRYDEGTARVHTPVISPVVIAASTPTGQDAFSGQIYGVRVGTTTARMAVLLSLYCQLAAMAGYHFL